CPLLRSKYRNFPRNGRIDDVEGEIEAAKKETRNASYLHIVVARQHGVQRHLQDEEGHRERHVVWDVLGGFHVEHRFNVVECADEPEVLRDAGDGAHPIGLLRKESR
ncbi:hypothetical protein PENTCL1PPCAC_15014, partial [Pristionchus entomophagus]